jgi:hypothetical protein
MLTYTHECPSTWLMNEKVKMVMTGFLVPAEYPVLKFGGQPSEYYFS